ncbi:MAG: sigma 54-interacting transcriptional regulator, partial [Planctomycetota bacterium]
MARVLIIDDDPGTQLLLQSRLRDLGHEVVLAPTGAMGVMEARNGGFDLFLVDVVLGAGIDGYEVCRRLKGMPHAHAVPVVLVSGVLKGRDDLHRGYEAGCDAFLLKGDNTQLEDVVRAMLRIKSLQDDLQLQNRLLDDHNRRLQEERRRGAEMETALSGMDRTPRGEAVMPRATMLVDGEGLVRAVDRGARELFGPDLEGRNLGSMAVGTGLEAFVRDARTERRLGFRLDATVPRSDQVERLTTAVSPIVPRPGHPDAGLRIVAFYPRVAAGADAAALESAAQLEEVRLAFGAGRFVGSSDLAADVRRKIAELAPRNAPLVLRGEPGSGRSLVARCVHHQGARRGPFLSLDCSSLGAESLEAELFGGPDEDGNSTAGLLERASGGTVFLSEVALLPLAVQQRLAAAIAEEKLSRVGETRRRKLRARVVAATSRDLPAAAGEGDFDAEFARLLTHDVLVLPALRDRPEDVPAMAERTLARFGGRLGRVRFSSDVERVLQSYDWPGNLRELEQAIERACRSLEGDEVGIEHLPRRLRDLHQNINHGDEFVAAGIDTGGPLATHMMTPTAARRPQTDYGRQALAEIGDPVSLETFEKPALLRALDETGGDNLAAARLL